MYSWMQAERTVRLTGIELLYKIQATGIVNLHTSERCRDEKFHMCVYALLCECRVCCEGCEDRGVEDDPWVAQSTIAVLADAQLVRCAVVRLS
jgi:hypothetical protein